MQRVNTKKIAIIGQGYVGLPLAMAAIDAGWIVIGIDNSNARVSMLNSGVSPVEDISDAKLKSALLGQSYLATSNFAEVSQVEVVAICVPTPLNDKREPDLSALMNAARAIAPNLANETLVVSESTSYPGTLREVIVPIIEEHKPANCRQVFYACAPERVNPGDMHWNQNNTPRLIGAMNSDSEIKALNFYKTICKNVICVSTPEVAEAAKLLENTFRLVNIGLINEFTKLCAASDIDVNEVIDAAATKPYGFMPFRPGVGVGGHCIPVDPLYLTWWGRKMGSRAEFIERADLVNLEMPKYVAKRAMSLAKPLSSNPKILIIGVAYKPGVSDTRETPALSLLENLRSLGANVAWHDPLVSSWHGMNSVDLNWEFDVAILANAQPGVNLNELLKKNKPILDCSNTIDLHPMVSKL